MQFIFLYTILNLFFIHFAWAQPISQPTTQLLAKHSGSGWQLSIYFLPESGASLVHMISPQRQLVYQSRKHDGGVESVNHKDLKITFDSEHRVQQIALRKKIVYQFIYNDVQDTLKSLRFNQNCSIDFSYAQRSISSISTQQITQMKNPCSSKKSQVWNFKYNLNAESKTWRKASEENREESL